MRNLDRAAFERALSGRLKVGRGLAAGTTRRGIFGDEVPAGLAYVHQQLCSGAAASNRGLRSEGQRLTLVVFGDHVVEAEVFILLETSLVVFDGQFRVGVGGVGVLQESTCTRFTIIS